MENVYTSQPNHPPAHLLDDLSESFGFDLMVDRPSREDRSFSMRLGEDESRTASYAVEEDCFGRAGCWRVERDE